MSRLKSSIWLNVLCTPTTTEEGNPCAPRMLAIVSPALTHPAHIISDGLLAIVLLSPDFLESTKSSVTPTNAMVIKTPNFTARPIIIF
jgi:hypothetical protein